HDEIPAIEGIDTVNGLSRVAGNTRLYRDLLAQFVAKHGDSDERIQSAVQRGDHSLAERIAHTVKGVAGNIGINNVHRAAERLERAIRDKQPGIDSLQIEFASALHGCTQRIRDAMPQQAEVAEDAAEFDPKEAAAALKALRVLLEASDAGACEAYERLLEKLSMKVSREHLASLGAIIHEFEFEQGLAMLNEMARENGLEVNYDDATRRKESCVAGR